MAFEGAILNPGEQAQAEEAERRGPSPQRHYQPLRIVLLGRSQAGKSSAGNIILGEKVFETEDRTEKCVIKNNEVHRRSVTVVDTPGWLSFVYGSEFFKSDITCSVSMCAPGPHAFLIVIPVVPFPESFRRAVEEHLQLLGERVWRHTIVLFTWGDRLGDKTIEQHIRDTGETLQWLVEKCGERYHVLKKNLEQQTQQVIMLLDKIDEMVAENKGEAFISEEILQEIERRLKQQEEELKQKYEERAREVEEKLKQEYEERERRMREEMEQRLEEEWRRREKKLKEKWK